MNQPTAIIYARVSSVGQAEEELPIASQIDQCQRKAAALGAKALRIFKDEGLSGRTTRRPEFKRARDFCIAHDVTYFIVWNSARFARSKADSAIEKLALRAAGTEIVYASNDIQTGTDEGWLTESIIEVFDEMYSRNVAKDTRRSMMKNAEDGNFNGGRVPLGYRVIQAGKRRRLEIDDEEAPVVRRIFSQYTAGAGCKVIAMNLNAAQLWKRGQRWTKTSVALVLKNHRYAGISIFNRRSHHERTTRPRADWITTASHEPIVDLAQFEEVQRMLGNRAPGSGQGSPHSQHVFTGMLRCSCGTNMKIETATGRSKTYSYYNCGAAVAGSGCPGRRIGAPAFDAWAMDELLTRLFTPERVKAVAESVHLAAGRWIHERKEQRDLLTHELRNVERRRDNIFEVMETHGKATPNLGDLTARLRELKVRITDIEQLLDELERAPAIPPGDLDIEVVTSELREAIEDWGSPERQRLFFAGFIQSIEVRDDEVTFVYHPDRLLNHVNSEAVVRSKERWLPERGFMRTAELTSSFPESLRLRRAA